MLSIEDGYLSIRPSNKWLGFSRLTTKTKYHVGRQFFLDLLRFRIIVGLDFRR